MNCGIHVIGKYCHNCGQENIEPKESVWHLISHFFNDITHFDSKFFITLKDLILKPGFLSGEYMKGRRASYLNPIRMYVFTSAIFFLIFFSLYKVDEKSLSIGDINGFTFAQINQMDSATFLKFSEKINAGKEMNKEEFKSTVEKMDSLKYSVLVKNIAEKNTITKAEIKAKVEVMDSAQLKVFTKKVTKGLPMTREEFSRKFENFAIAPGNYRSKKEYDSLLKAGVKKHNWIERQLVYKNIELKEKFGSDPKLIVAELINRFMHTLPQLLFVLLPLFALILKFVYIRRKHFYYVDHVIFTIHFYIFIFLVMLITFGLGKLKSLLHWNWLSYISFLFVLGIFFYFYKALRNFYHQRRAKTIIKYFILLFSFLITTVCMFIVFFFFSLLGL